MTGKPLIVWLIAMLPTNNMDSWALLLGLLLLEDNICLLFNNSDVMRGGDIDVRFP